MLIKERFFSKSSHHQTHFEQYGNVEGIVKIDGNQYKISTSGLRDRTIGAKRDWSDFHRYAIHWFRLDNGNAITIGVVSMPVMFTRYYKCYFWRQTATTMTVDFFCFCCTQSGLLSALWPTKKIRSTFPSIAARLIWMNSTKSIHRRVIILTLLQVSVGFARNACTFLCIHSVHIYSSNSC